ncbi:uncharacterized protein KY384_001055 [Bacidia gigantensis]|uniref:uncharacterized protein n=1 Tax=Bacidia gigantensis TaxID=2732470 RepID=UPI001D03F391|nr:uncharacterized protein KY384_001055 [Bacidia gigantensis]KAG8534211.1 hypothetical protein KY384_001055 [Bacidia gigantensis]
MSDLVGGAGMSGRSQNGSGLGPVPAPPPIGGEGGRATPPTEIMARRRAREAKRREENERRRREDAEARERALERTTVVQDDGPGAAGGPSNRRSGRTSIVDPTGQSVQPERRLGDRTSAGSERGGDPAGARTSRVMSEDPTQQRIRPPSGQTRPAEPIRTQIPVGVQPLTSDNPASQTRQTSRPTRASQTRGDRPASGASAQPQGAADQTPRSNASSFPHAFERWEQLSSHWEGLTSYWIHRIEQNKDDLNREPLNQQMARQVTDLSAAGANLFHAVVELQRLRASSERKFQRWFFETRAEQERARETQAKLEEQLRTERQARTENVTSSARYENDIRQALAARHLADTQVREVRRELTISKDEARRAWEELGRREQEERDRMMSLKAGRTTYVGGVEVVPMLQNTSRPGTQPSTRDSQARALSGYDSRSNEPVYGYDAARNDPIPPIPAAQGYQQTSNTSSAALQAAQAASAPTSQGQSQGIRTTTTTTTMPSGGTYLSYSNGDTYARQPPATFYQHEGTTIHPEGRAASIVEGDERSYVPSVSPSVSEVDYDLDENGEVRRDATGNPIVSRRGLGSEDSDEYNVESQVERERQYGQTYGSPMSGVEYGSGPTTTAPADYEGRGYGTGFESTPHHHPTRLSDVPEEDERSRTSLSRASQHSRGLR